MMNKAPQTFLWYALMIVPVLVSMRGKIDIAILEYAFFTLFFIAIAVWRQIWWPSLRQTSNPLIESSLAHSHIQGANSSTRTTYVAYAAYFIETIYGAWLSSQYEGMLFMLSGSTLLSISPQWSRRVQMTAIVVTLACFNVSLIDRAETIITIANLAGCAIALLHLYALKLIQELRNLVQLNAALRIQAHDLEAAKQDVLLYAGRIEQTAQADERNRIAHELHDELGHKLVRVKLMMDAAVQVAEHRPEQAAALTSSVRDQLSDSMDLLRRTVRKMKPADGTVRSYSLDRLVQQCNEDGQLSVALELSGMPFPLYPSVEIMLYRNAQEAISNAIRHGQATKVKLALHYDNNKIMLEAENNGLVPEGKLQIGLGLRGMQERAATLGGQVEWFTLPAFIVRTVVPYNRY
ncbi:sensor histidine kinase [Paenibacillus sp. 481]|uniref:sensor histidine kinase n=1 Tax=Paenibacillus sp. 481 TaxID=2835869 RepID=UPI001E5ADCD4|nr:sensor histidine kinase [Paenibacillus sp. 481]UHA74852.1 sensor histidine kinase [Paenibacillus sp. 481]